MSVINFKKGLTLIVSSDNKYDIFITFVVLYASEILRSLAKALQSINTCLIVIIASLHRGQIGGTGSIASPMRYLWVVMRLSRSDAVDDDFFSSCNAFH